MIQEYITHTGHTAPTTPNILALKVNLFELLKNPPASDGGAKKRNKSKRRKQKKSNKKSRTRNANRFY